MRIGHGEGISAGSEMDLEIFQPGSFKISMLGAEEDPLRFGRTGSAYALYYSFVTMSTLGYGDIIPATMPARAAASLEAVLGQMYLAVLVARLVGLHVAHSRFGRGESDAE